MGTHKALKSQYPIIGKRRRELVDWWVAGDPRGDDYEKYDLPVLATALSHNWEEFVEPNGSNLTPTVLAKVKNEIIDLLVSSFAVSPPDGYGSVTRRSNRLQGNVVDQQIVVPATSKRKVTRQPRWDESDSEEEDDDDDDGMLIDDGRHRRRN